MPYVVRKRKGKKCVYKKKKNGKPGEKVGCTKKSIKKYLAALHINANESLEENKMQKIPHLPGDLKHKFHWAIEYPYETEYGIDDSKHFIGSLRKDWPEDSDMDPPRLVTGYLPNDMSVERKRQHSYTTSLEKGWYVIEQAPLSGQQPILGPFSSHKEAYAAGKELYEREELRENKKIKIKPSRLREIIQEEVGCTDGPIKDYLAALHINANESLEDKTMKISKQKLERIIKEEVAREMRMRKEERGDYDGAGDDSYVDYQKTGSELTNLGQQIAAAFEKDRQNPDLEFLTLRGSEAVELLGSGPDNDAGAKSNFVDVMAGAGVDPKQTRMILAVMKELKYNEYN